MVYAYFVEAHPVATGPGIYKRKVKYIDARGKDHEREFLCDKNGKFESTVYGGVNTDGTPKCKNKSEAENMSLSMRQANREASGATARAKKKYEKQKKKKEIYTQAYNELVEAGVKFKTHAQSIKAQKKHMTKHDVHIPNVGVYNKKEIKQKWLKKFHPEYVAEQEAAKKKAE